MVGSVKHWPNGWLSYFSAFLKCFPLIAFLTFQFSSFTRDIDLCSESKLMVFFDIVSLYTNVSITYKSVLRFITEVTWVLP